MLFVFSSCKLSKQTVEGQKSEYINKSITFFRSVCYGSCPSFNIEINEDGSFLYKGISNVNNIGDFKGRLSENQKNNLFKTLENIKWETYLDEYPVKNHDFPGFSFKYNNGTDSKTIIANSGAPKELIDLSEFLDALILTLEMKK